MIKNPITHLVWTIGVLIAIISALLWRLPNGSALSSYIAFAASIASLVLAVVAIFQALLSSETFTQSISEIRTSAQKIVDETSRLGKASVTLGAEAESLLKRLSSLPEEISTLKGEISDSFDKLSTGFNLANEPSGELHSDTGKLFEGKTIGFLVAMYIFSLSIKHNKYIDFDDMFSDAKYTLPKNYSIGVVATLKYFNIFGSEIEGIGSTFYVKNAGSFKYLDAIEYITQLKYESEAVVESLNVINRYFDESFAFKATTTEHDVVAQP